MAELLAKNEVKRLITKVRELTRYIAALHSEDKLYTSIQYPKTPTVLTESIVYHLLMDKKILSNVVFSELKFNVKASTAETNEMPTDIIGVVGNNEYLIEVKGSQSKFTQFNKKDVASDCVIWVEFGSTFRSRSASISVAVIENPALSGLTADKYTWESKKFAKLPKTEFAFSSIKSILG